MPTREDSEPLSDMTPAALDLPKPTTGLRQKNECDDYKLVAHVRNVTSIRNMKRKLLLNADTTRLDGLHEQSRLDVR